MKDYIRVKNKVNPPNRFRNIQIFSYAGWTEKIGPYGSHFGFFSKFLISMFTAL